MRCLNDLSNWEREVFRRGVAAVVLNRPDSSRVTARREFICGAEYALAGAFDLPLHIARQSISRVAGTFPKKVSDVKPEDIFSDLRQKGSLRKQ